MATTTNYSWTTPDDTALVKDGAAAIRTLGSSVDTTVKNLNPETTLGDIAYRSSTANVKTRLGIGSSGDVLTVSGGVPAWVAPAPAVPANAVAKVTTSQTTTSGSYTDLSTVGPEVTLTTGTKALVIVSCNAGNSGGGSYSAYMGYAVSGASTISATDETCLRLNNTGDAGQRQRASAASIVTLTAGSNVFTAKYKSDFSGTSTFVNREINVINLA